MIKILKTVKKINYIFFFHKKFLKLFIKSILLEYQLIFSVNNMIHLHLITQKDRNKRDACRIYKRHEFSCTCVPRDWPH